jgi:2-polyprenyl-3-methyl-5-hydroxy-6-metoxy-1,4-benzoquinol methylase
MTIESSSSPQLTEHAIRPANTANEQKRRYEADMARMLSRRSEFIDVACPACGGRDRHVRFEKLTLSYQECEDCRTVYISPRPSPAVLRDYYENSENYAYWNSVIFPASESARRERIFRPRVKRLLDLCERHGVTTGTLVEVGPGFGTFGEELRATNAFKRVIVIEPTPELAQTCRSRGLEVIEATVETAVIDTAVDVVASFEVIEHLFEPAVFVRLCARLLRPGGVLVLTCPNVNGFDVDVLGPESPAIDGEHLNYFHPASLGRLLEDNGFAVLESQTPGVLDADIVRNRMLSGEAGIQDRFLRRVLIDEWSTLGAQFQEFLTVNGLSSNMWIAARKK